MTDDPRAALTTLVAAFERHLEACASRRGDGDPTVLAAADDLADAFDLYDDALLAAFGEMTPLEVYDGDDGDDEDDDADDDDDDVDEDEHEEEDDADVVLGDDEVDDHDGEDGENGVYSGLEGDYEWAPRSAEDDRASH